MKQRAVIIGIGTIAVVHLSVLEAMSDTVEIVGLCDIDETRLAPYKDRYPTFTDYNDMLTKIAPTIAHICLPHGLHLGAIKACQAAGVAVFTEKPVTATAAQADELLELSQTPEAPPIGVCFQNRYNPTFVTALDAVRQGTYGAPTFVRGVVPWARSLEYYTQAPWRGEMAIAGGGVMMNQAIHTLDQMLLIGGGQALEARGLIGRLTDYPIEVEDTATARLHMQNGIDGLFQATVAHVQNESVQLTIYFERGRLNIEYGILTATTDDGTTTELCRDIPLGGAKSYYGSGHGAAIKAFYEAVSDQTDDYIHVADAIPAIYAIDAIRRSSESDQAPTATQTLDANTFVPRWSL